LFSIFADAVEAGTPIDSEENPEVLENFLPLPVRPQIPKAQQATPQLEPPPNDREQLHETPDEWTSPTGRQEAEILSRTQGDPSAAQAEAEESASAASPNLSSIAPVDDSVILNTDNFTNDFRMSPNFNWGMCYDPTGGHVLRDQVGLTKQQIVSNCSNTLNNCIEPLIEKQVLPEGMDGYGNLWKVTSGYRQGNGTSQHNKGQAFDIALIKSPLSEKANATYEMVQEIARTVPYDQLILEYRNPSSIWVHISFKTEGNRGQAFTMVNDSTYGQGFHLLSSIPPKAR
jgi:hypothetical protein